MQILLLGQGQVSRELQLSLYGQGELTVRGRAQLDLADSAQIRQQVCQLRPDLIVNAAAYTAVDQAESEPQLAFAVNATAPGVLAEEAAALGAPLIHYSTDYAYNATGRSSWRTGTAPCSSARQARASPPRLSLEALNLLLQAGR